MALEKVQVEISVVLGKSVIPMQQLLRMGRGAVIELDATQNDEVWVLANNQPVARGEIMIQGEKICVTITRTLAAAA
jgi:flagellar motor switch protein FliN